MTNENANKMSFDGQQQAVLDCLRNENRSVFLTGVAGCGKSTLLRHWLSELSDRERAKVACLAPTGIAAVNVRGQTVHSFFGLRPGVIDPNQHLASRAAMERLSAVDTIVIDEVSMVAADVFTAMDISLRSAQRGDGKFLPFGGVRLVMVGDLHQLPPVVPGDMRVWYKRTFNSPEGWFFHAPIFRELSPAVFNLTRSYRQRDDDGFVELLNRLREDDTSAIAEINAATPAGSTAPSTAPILAPRNKTVSEYNQKKLDALKSPVFDIEADIEGDVKPSMMPAAKVLQLAEGARIMTIRNGDSYVNGSLGFVRGVDGEVIHIELDDGEEVGLKPATWEITKYKASGGGLESSVVGTVKQYPLKLAWALTVHKSQGQGFPHALLDTDGGMFAAGQLYVALSRIESLRGVYLRRQLTRTDLRVSKHVVKFLREHG